MTLTDKKRQFLIARLRKLQTLFEHPATPPPEAEAARNRFNSMVKRYGIDLLKEPAPPKPVDLFDPDQTWDPVPPEPTNCIPCSQFMATFTREQQNDFMMRWIITEAFKDHAEPRPGWKDAYGSTRGASNDMKEFKVPIATREALFVHRMWQQTCQAHPKWFIAHDFMTGVYYPEMTANAFKILKVNKRNERRRAEYRLGMEVREALLETRKSKLRLPKPAPQLADAHVAQGLL